jgi:hypothetical protein
MNIFARELAKVLANHGFELNRLYSIKSRDISIPPSKVQRLIRSLKEAITVTLNSNELEMLQQEVPFDEDGEEMRRLRAALLAETVQRLLAGRMATNDAAFQIAEMTLQFLLCKDNEDIQRVRDRVLEEVRGGFFVPNLEREVKREVSLSSNTGDRDQLIESAMDAATESYELGTLWLEVACDTADRGLRQGYLAQALALLNRARDLAINAASITHNTPQQYELLRLIDITQRQCKLLD